MAGNQLTATSAPSGTSQSSSSQNIQSASSGNFLPGQKSSAVQSGTPTAALSSSTGGIQLGSSSPTIVHISNAPITSTKTESVKQSHSASPITTGLSFIFIAAAIILLWSAARPVKNTTK